ncbi:unnamed protein product [Macrosiphum euphorbiae]|uniref:Transposable element P transposase-like GTP-binding insertion domain-containing protein n=1 Tax=Macrosiphum euphorbiae TaxID=13131 RepID=A0AAV0XMI9_9HEMI|nr:unnamed protein product [Macrosiphum euphorbiae]
MGLNFANKISASHVDWRKNIMKVRLAAETLSSSTADALEALNCLNVSEFKNVEETIKFIRTIDRLFDFLNTRSPFGKGFKKPLYQNNVEKQKGIILPLIKYLLKLTDVKGIPISSTPRKTFVIG